jgi:hypothetical protein
MTRSCFASVIFPANQAYYNDFIGSLNSQTGASFDLILFNDGIVDIKNLIQDCPFQKGLLKIISVEGSPAEIRTLALKHLADSTYTNCVFGDSDDYFSSNRVEESIRSLDNGTDVVFCDLDIVDASGEVLNTKYYSNRLKDRFEPDMEFLLTKNVCGLGNTAIKINALPKNLNFPVSIMAVDWLLYSRMKLEGKRITFTNKATISYRQHEENSIGIGVLSKERVKKGIQVKMAHYECLSTENDLLSDLYLEIQKIFVFLDDQEGFDRYYEGLKQNPIEFPFWWEEITLTSA